MSKKYKLKALNIFLCGKMFKKEENFVFETKDFPKGELEVACKNGFLVEIKEEEKPLEIKESEIVPDITEVDFEEIPEDAKIVENVVVVEDAKAEDKAKDFDSHIKNIVGKK